MWPGDRSRSGGSATCIGASAPAGVGPIHHVEVQRAVLGDVDGTLTGRVYCGDVRRAADLVEERPGRVRACPYLSIIGEPVVVQDALDDYELVVLGVSVRLCRLGLRRLLGSAAVLVQGAPHELLGEGFGVAGPVHYRELDEGERVAQGDVLNSCQ